MKKIIVIVLLFFAGCRTYKNYEVSMLPVDYQPVKAEQKLVVPKDGHYYSQDGLEMHDKSVIFRYEMRKKGFLK